MHEFMILMIGIIQIMILDLTLSGDNIGVIALVTRRLPEDKAKLASFFGIMGALLLRVFFACTLSYILYIKWLPIKLVGGILLLKITWDFIKPQKEEEHVVKDVSALKDAIFAIIVADISMSLDNVLALAAAADGRLLLLVFGILLNVPIIFFGSKFVANMMNKYEIIIFIGGAILAHTALKMIFEDSLLLKYIQIPEFISVYVPYLAASAVILYGVQTIRKKDAKEDSQLEVEE